MSLDLTNAAHRGSIARLGPYGARLLERAADVALAVHADEVTGEHLLSAIMDDDDCAAHRVVLHAFADPETISVEALATAPGILVVGSERTIPFSVRGVDALFSARALAASERAERVTPAHGLLGAVAALPEALRADLEQAGYVPPRPSPAGEGEAVPAEGPLFRFFDDDARRLLAFAGRLATRLRRRAIGPVHLLLAALEKHADLGRSVGLSPTRARAAIGARDEDATPLPPRDLPPAEELGRFLSGLPAGADSLALLEHFLSHGSPELGLLLRHNRITQELVARSRSAFRDPAL